MLFTTNWGPLDKPSRFVTIGFYSWPQLENSFVSDLQLHMILFCQYPFGSFINDVIQYGTVSDPPPLLSFSYALSLMYLFQKGPLSLDAKTNPS